MPKTESQQVLVCQDADPEEPRSHLLCKRCGIKWPLPLPIDLSAMIDMTDAFEKKHRRCKKR